MSRATLEDRVAALERQVGALLSNHPRTGRTNDWRRTRGGFTRDDLMKRIIDVRRPIRDAAGDGRHQTVRISTTLIGMTELPLASLALVNVALLISAHSRDFYCVPESRFENWLQH